jgi:hypothetical protein
MHSNAVVDAAVWFDASIDLGQGCLHLDGALHGLYRASEFRKHTIARRVRYAAPVFPNEPVEDCAPFGQALKRADLVSAHEATITFDIRCEDCDKLPADCRRV